MLLINPPAAAARFVVVAGNKPGGFASFNQALGSRVVLLAVDGQRTAPIRSVCMVVRAAAGGDAENEALSTEQIKEVVRAAAGGDAENEALSTEQIKEVAEEMSYYLQRTKEITPYEKMSLSKDLQVLQNLCSVVMEEVDKKPDQAMTLLLGIQARLLSLVSGNKKDVLLSSTDEIKVAMDNYICAHKIKITPHAYGTSIVDLINDPSFPLKSAATLCSLEEVEMVLRKTVKLIDELQPTHSTVGQAGMFRVVRRLYHGLLDDVEKNGVKDNTSVGIFGLHKKYFAYEDAPDDTLPSSFRRLEMALRDYGMQES